MSRTKKDRPYWVRANDPSENRTEHHEHSRFGRVYYKLSGEVIVAKDYCTIDEPTRAGWFRWDWSKPCFYSISRIYYYDKITPEIRRNSYWGPLRNDERMVLRNAVKDYNTFGEIDEDFFLQENHHHACYGGGYWD